MPEIRVSRVEIRSMQTFGVVLGRSNGVSCYVMLPREDVRYYREELEKGHEVTLDVPGWKIAKVADGLEELGG